MAKSNAPKLSPEARDLVIEKLIVGESCEEIRTALQNAGYPSNLTRAAFSYYRRMEVVQNARKLIHEEAIESGMATMASRVSFFSDRLKAIKKQVERAETVAERMALEAYREQLAEDSARREETTDPEELRLRTMGATQKARKRSSGALYILSNYSNLIRDAIACSDHIEKLLDASKIQADLKDTPADQTETGNGHMIYVTDTMKRIWFNDLLEQALNEYDEEQAAKEQQTDQE